MLRIFAILAAVLLSASVFAQSPEKMSYQAVIRNANDELVKNQAVGMQISILQGSADGIPVYIETQTPSTNANGLVTVEIGAGTSTDDFTNIDWANGPYFIKTETDPIGGTNYTITGTSQLLSVPYALHAKTAESVSNLNIAGNETAFDSWDKNQADDFDGQYSSLSDAPSNVSEFNNDAGYITEFSEVDGDVTNEIQDLQLDGNNLTITGTATTIDLSAYLDNTDTQLSETKVDTYVANNGYLTTEIDGSITNEIQSLEEVATINNSVNTQIKNVTDPTYAQDAATKSYVDALKQQIKILENSLISTGNYKLEDIDGNQYDVVKIGNQAWMSENLKTTKYNDGSEIPLVTDGTTWSNLTTPAFCWYIDDAAYADTYGAYYNWYTIEAGNLCPTDWHIPTDADWSIMENYLIANGYNYDGTITINKIAKSLASTTNWTLSTNEGDVGNTDYPAFRNKTGFTAISAGFRYFN